MGKRILFIIPGKPTGGSDLLLANIVNAADTRDNELMVIGYGGAPENTLPLKKHIHRHTILRRHTLDSAPLLELRRTLKHLRPEVIFCASYTFFVLARFASIGLGISSRYLITWHEESAQRSFTRNWYRLITRLMSRRDQLIMTTKRQLKQHDPVDPVREGRVRIIQNGVDNRFWIPVQAGFDRSAVRGHIGIPTDAKLIIMSASLRPENDHRSAVDALRVLCHDLHVDTHLLFIGTGVENGRLRLAATRAGLKHRIHFLGHVRDIRELYWAADLISLTARNAEIFPSGTLEGMSCGLPAVATDGSAVAEFIEDGINGFLATSNPYDIAVKWHKALRQKFSSKEIHRMMKKKVNLGRMTREYQEAMGVN